MTMSNSTTTYFASGKNDSIKLLVSGLRLSIILRKVCILFISEINQIGKCHDMSVDRRAVKTEKKSIL